MGSCIHEVNYDTVKNTVAVYRVYKTFIFCVFSTSFHSVPVEELSLQVSGLASHHVACIHKVVQSPTDSPYTVG